HPSPKIYSASAKEPWVLATNLPVEIRTPKQLVNIGTVAKLAMRQPFVLFKGLTFQKLCLPGAFRPG
ncbi:hypothetical protein EPU44_28810, partial [Escherichia coli]